MLLIPFIINYCYRVPQVLLYFGILDYSEKLTQTLKQGMQLFLLYFYDIYYLYDTKVFFLKMDHQKKWRLERLLL